MERVQRTAKIHLQIIVVSDHQYRPNYPDGEKFNTE